MPPDFVLGIAIGANQLVVALVRADDAENRTVASVPFAGGVPDDLIDTAHGLAQQLSRDARTEAAPPQVIAVGAAVPGHVDHGKGVVVYGQNLESQGLSWTDEKLADMLTDAFHVPAVIENDVNAMAIYQQAHGLGQGESSFVVVYLAPDLGGLGSGIVIDGQLVRGYSGGAGELGHLVVQPRGPRCPCGKRGCLEAVVGVDNIVRNVNWGGRDIVHERDLTHAAALADAGDARAVDTFRQAGRWFGQGLSALVNLLNPPLTIIGGPDEIVGPVAAESAAPRNRRRQAKQTRRVGSRSAALFREGYESTLADYSYAKLKGDCRIAITTLTVEMAAVGAAMLAVRRHAPEPTDLQTVRLPVSVS